MEDIEEELLQKDGASHKSKSKKDESSSSSSSSSDDENASEFNSDIDGAKKKTKEVGGYE